MEGLVIIATVIIVLILIGIMYILYMLNNLVNRNKLYNSLINTYKNIYLDRYYWCKVRCSTKNNYMRLFKLIPWNGYGLMVLRGSEILVICSSNKVSDFTFNKDKIIINWIGKKDLRNGIFSWINIDEDNKCIYITSETGFFGISSEETTKNIFKKITNK